MAVADRTRQHLALERLWLGRFPRKGQRQAQESRKKKPDFTTFSFSAAGNLVWGLLRHSRPAGFTTHTAVANTSRLADDVRMFIKENDAKLKVKTD